MSDDLHFNRIPSRASVLGHGAFTNAARAEADVLAELETMPGRLRTVGAFIQGLGFSQPNSKVPERFYDTLRDLVQPIKDAHALIHKLRKEIKTGDEVGVMLLTHREELRAGMVTLMAHINGMPSQKVTAQRTRVKSAQKFYDQLMEKTK